MLCSTVLHANILYINELFITNERFNERTIKPFSEREGGGLKKKSVEIYIYYRYTVKTNPQFWGMLFLFWV